MTATGSKECPNESMDTVSQDVIIGIGVRAIGWIFTVCLKGSMSGSRTLMPAMNG